MRLAREIDALFTRQIKPKDWSENKWVSGWQGCWESFIRLRLSDQTEVSTPGFVKVPLSLRLLRFFHPVNLFFFCLALFSLYQSSRGLAEALLSS